MGTYLHLFDEEQEQTAHINSAQYREPYFAGVNATYKAYYNKFSQEGIKKVEYLRNSGYAYIDTGIKMHKYYGMGCKFKIISYGSGISQWKIFCGCRTTFYYSLNWNWTSHSVLFDYLGGGTLSVNPSHNVNNIITAETRPDVTNKIMYAYCDGVQKSQYAMPDTDAVQTVNSWIFTAYNDYRGQQTNIYQFWITNQYNEKILNLIPIKKDNIGYMYDTINNRIFSKSGDGTFIIGPEL